MRGLPVLRWCSQHPWHDGPVPEGGLLAVLMTGIAAAPSVLHVGCNVITFFVVPTVSPLCMILTTAAVFVKLAPLCAHWSPNRFGR